MTNQWERGTQLLCTMSGGTTKRGRPELGGGGGSPSAKRIEDPVDAGDGQLIEAAGLWW